MIKIRRNPGTGAMAIITNCAACHMINGFTRCRHAIVAVKTTASYYVIVVNTISRPGDRDMTIIASIRRIYMIG